MRIFKAVLLLYLIFDGFAEDLKEETFKVFRIFPRDWRDIQNLATLRNMSEDSEVDFWLDSRQPGQFAEVMVSPRSQVAVRDWLVERNLRFRVTINDVEKLIHQQEHSFKPTKKTSSSSSASTSTERINPLFSNSAASSYENDVQLQQIHRLRDSPINDDKTIVGDRPFEQIYKLKGYNYPFGEYTNYATMLRYMRTIEFYYPHLAKLIRIGTTHEGRPIEGLKIGYHVSNSTKRAFWIDGNIHAREWASSHTALFIINQLIGGYGKDPTITHYMNNLNFLIVPCLNSDGYEYSRSSFSPDIRLWRKNRSPEKCANSVWGGLRCCQGVDLNRNFNFYWAQTGASTNPCSSIFAGDKAFSEPETKAVNDFLMSDEYRFKLDGFITIHSYGQLFIHPYSHEVEYYPNDIRKLESVAKKAVEKLRNVYGTQYRIGTGADLLSPASGGSDDWAKESLDTKYVYLIELRPQLELSRGFILNQDELIPTAIETFEGIKAVIEAVLEDNGIIPRPVPRRSGNKEHAPPRMHSVPSTPVANGNNLNRDKFVNGRFGSQNPEAELSPFRAPVEIIKQQSDGFISKATLTVFETSTTTEPPTTTTTTTTRRSTVTTPTTTMSTTVGTTTVPSTITSASTAPSTTTTKATTTTPRTTPSTTTRTTTTTTKATTLSTTTPPSTTTRSTTPLTTTLKLTTSTATTIHLPTTTEPSTIYKVLEALTSRPSPDTMARRLTQELLRKQLLRLQALKTIKETIRERLSSSTASSPLPVATIYHAPRFLTAASSTKSSTESSTSSSMIIKTTTTMQLPPLIVGNNKTTAKTTASSSSSSNPLQFQPSTTACVDKKYSCTFWIKADRRVCENQQRFMRLNCARSCKFCDT